MLSIIAAAAAGAAGTRVYLAMKERLAMPLRFRCPHCDFSMRAGRGYAELFEQGKAEHMEVHR